MGVDERDEEHVPSSRVTEMLLGGGSRRPASSREKTKVMSRSVSKAEDETSSSSWLQMLAEAKMLALGLRIIQEEMESSSAEPEDKDKVAVAVAEEQVGSSSSSNEEHAASSSWVVEMQRIIDDMKRWTRPSIYRVPDWLKSMTKAEAYRPQVVSLGPFHHDEQSLRPMEEHKRRLMLHMVEKSKKSLDMFKEAIKEVAEELQGAYDGLDDEEWRGDNTDRFVDVMVTDGGFLLEFMTTVRCAKRKTMTVSQAGYAPYDPIFSQRSLLSLWPRLRSDMILVENQVPLLALKKLEAVRSGTSPVRVLSSFIPRTVPYNDVTSNVLLSGYKLRHQYDL